jgi:hypothetical protein
MEVGQGPNWGCRPPPPFKKKKKKKKKTHMHARAHTHTEPHTSLCLGRISGH